jgi:hypothetical protein
VVLVVMEPMMWVGVVHGFLVVGGLPQAQQLMVAWLTQVTSQGWQCHWCMG